MEFLICGYLALVEPKIKSFDQKLSLFLGMFFIMISLFFLTFSYLTAVVLDNKFFKHEATIDSITDDIAEAECVVKNLLGSDAAIENDIEAQ